MKNNLSHSTVCEVCGSAPAVHVCPICGRRVCRNDWSGDVCIVCSEALCRVCGTRLAIASCNVCGRPVCEKCSVQVNPVVRICSLCAGKLGVNTRQWPPRHLVLAELRRLGENLNELSRI